MTVRLACGMSRCIPPRTARHGCHASAKSPVWPELFPSQIKQIGVGLEGGFGGFDVFVEEGRVEQAGV